LALTALLASVACQDSGSSVDVSGADASAAGAAEPTDKDPGALVAVEMSSTVGVLLDEIPESERDRVAALLFDEAPGFWKQRAGAQVALAGYPLVFRDFFYDEEEGKGQLPLPPAELWRFELLSEPGRVTVQGHDLVSVDFRRTDARKSNGRRSCRVLPEVDVIRSLCEPGRRLLPRFAALVRCAGYCC
jgi:hypothetical protein